MVTLTRGGYAVSVVIMLFLIAEYLCIMYSPKAMFSLA